MIQSIRDGALTVRELPDPSLSTCELLVGTRCSAISVGTERYVVDLASKSLLGKARERPDHVRRIFQKVKQEGLRTTLMQVQGRLDEPMPLGYSLAGVVLECGASVQDFKPGDRVSAAAPHAASAIIGKNLCARVPAGVSFEQAAYAPIAAIGLQGVRLAKLSLGDSVLVIGLGLIGQICICLLKAQGCRVFATDLDPAKLALARSLGADATALGSPLASVMEFTGSSGVDAAILTAATESNEPIEFAAEASRPKGRIVLVGVAGLNLPRPPFFKKELEFTVSCSLGPGRGDPLYEGKGIDYPVGYARWTAQRNMQAVLDLMDRGQLPVDKLTTHRFPIERASEAYDLITKRREPCLGILLNYPIHSEKRRRRIELRKPASLSAKLGVSMVGAGNFTRLVLLPTLSKLEDVSWRGICSVKGVNAEHTGRRHGFQFATTDAAEIWNDRESAAVFIATRHDLHADLVIAALRAGKHVFVEKPLCITLEQLHRIQACIEELGDCCPLIAVGFNRRFAPAVGTVKEFFANVLPLSISYRFSPGHVPADHWTQDQEVGGGRIIGEACHAIDTCVAIAGSPPEKVYAESVNKSGAVETTDDRVFITIRHRNGSISNVSYQAGGDRAFPTERVEVFGGGRTAVIDGWNEVQLWSGNHCRRSSGHKDKGHRMEFDTFIQRCRQGGLGPISWEDLYGVTWASIAAVNSIREGLPFWAGE